MRRVLLSSIALLALCSAARADLVNNPGIFGSTSFTAGDCLQATGQNSVATTGAPCGSGNGAGNIVGPVSSTIGVIAVWNDASGTSLANSTIQAASIPSLGASQTWAGLNTFEVRPVFNGATPWDALNLPSPLTTTVAASTYETIAAAAATYLTQTAATATYETIANAAATFLPKTGGTLPFLNLSAAAGTWKPISFNTGASQRWQIGSNNSGETGSNAGSDFDVFAYADNGSVLSNAVHIQRSTGQVSLSARPTFAGNLAWDAGNFNPASFTTPASLATALAPYLTTAIAASTYLTQIAAAATYTTPAEVNTALSTFLTIANASSTYLTQVAAQQTYATIAGVQSAYLRIVDAAATYCALSGCTLASLNIPTLASSDNSTHAASTAYVTAALVPYATNAIVAATYATIAGVQSAYLRIDTAASLYAPLNSPALTGNPTAPTPTTTDNDTSIATTAMVHSAVSAATVILAPLASPIFTGTPTAPTQTANDNSTRLATTAYVTSAVAVATVKPYDVRVDFQGPANTVLGNLGYALHYVFDRSVTCPDHFAGAQFNAVNFAAASATLTVEGPVKYGNMGTITVSALQRLGTWAVATTSIGFAAGDELNIVLTTGDTHLGGISITIPCTLVN